MPSFEGDNSSDDMTGDRKVFGQGESDRGRNWRDLYTTNVSKQVKLSFYCNISIESRSRAPQGLQIGPDNLEQNPGSMPEFQCLAALLLPADRTYLHVGMPCFSRVTGNHDLVRLRIKQSVSGGTAPKLGERWLAPKVLEIVTRRTVGERGAGGRYKLRPCAVVLCGAMSSLA